MTDSIKGNQTLETIQRTGRIKHSEKVRKDGRVRQAGKVGQAGKNQDAASFEKALQQEMLYYRQMVQQQELISRQIPPGSTGEIKFSAHAEKRLKERNINLMPADFLKINEAVRKAEAKGARDSLLLYGDLALVASIKNKTVVTALTGDDMVERVFTNIDSAVIVKK